MMMEITAVMCIAGDSMFFKYASYSIPSFLRNNPSTDFFAFTDKPEKLEKHKAVSSKFNIVDIRTYRESRRVLVQALKSKGRSEETLQKHADFYGYRFEDIYPIIMPPMAEETLKSKGYSYILKVDSDSYFASGDMMALVRKDVIANRHAELFLVERKHPDMKSKTAPGSGFTLWKIGSWFIPEYIKQFHGSQQLTIQQLRNKFRSRTKTLQRPGYHFVHPFRHASNMGREFTKEMALRFAPAYFHLYGPTAIESMEKLEKWFGGNSDG